jgi:SAM-dependent methyltransferase
MQPYLRPPKDDDARSWRAAAAVRRRAIFGRLAMRVLSGGRRDADAVRKEYGSAWAAGHARYQPDRREPKFSPWMWRDERLLFDAAGAQRFRTLLYAGVIERLRPKRVLEVGSGDGINLLVLAGAFPGVSFTGLELTENGLAAARRALSTPSTTLWLNTYSSLKQRDERAIERLRFVQGTATHLPFCDGAFDLVFTALAIEQMEQVRAEALREIARVTGGHLLTLEPFREVNAVGFRRLNVIGRDYFRGSINDLPTFHLMPEWATADFPQEVFLGAALVLSRKE